jgi:hypothetical protein
MNKIRQQKILKRILNKIKLPNDEWENIEKIFKDMWYEKDGEEKYEYSKNEICGYLGITSAEYKILRKYFWGQL